MLVLGISAGIFYLLVQDDSVKKDIVKTLEGFGDHLLAMVPDADQRITVKQQYDKFLEKAEKDELNVEEIEQITANIFNLTTQDTIVTREEALSAITLNNNDSLATTICIVSNINDEIAIPTKTRFQLPLPPKRVQYTPQNRKKRERNLLGDLERLHELREYVTYLAETDTQFKPLKHQIYFKADSGLKVIINSELVAIGNDMNINLKKLRTQISELERNHLVRWKENLQAYKLAEFERILEMEQFLLTQHHLELLANRGAFGGMDMSFLDSLQMANPDSLKQLLTRQKVLWRTRTQRPNYRNNN